MWSKGIILSLYTFFSKKYIKVFPNLFISFWPPTNSYKIHCFYSTLKLELFWLVSKSSSYSQLLYIYLWPIIKRFKASWLVYLHIIGCTLCPWWHLVFALKFILVTTLLFERILEIWSSSCWCSFCCLYLPDRTQETCSTWTSSLCTHVFRL